MGLLDQMKAFNALQSESNGLINTGVAGMDRLRQVAGETASAIAKVPAAIQVGSAGGPGPDGPTEGSAFMAKDGELPPYLGPNGGLITPPRGGRPRRGGPGGGGRSDWTPGGDGLSDRSGGGGGGGGGRDDGGDWGSPPPVPLNRPSGSAIIPGAPGAGMASPLGPTSTKALGDTAANTYRMAADIATIARILTSNGGLPRDLSG